MWNVQFILLIFECTWLFHKRVVRTKSDTFILMKWVRWESIYTYWLGMRVITLLLSPMYQLLSEAFYCPQCTNYCPRPFIVPNVPTIVRGNADDNRWYRGAPNIKSMSVLLYWTAVQFKILNCRFFSDEFLVYFISAL
jgi:hypothetical protein